MIYTLIFILIVILIPWIDTLGTMLLYGMKGSKSKLFIFLLTSIIMMFLITSIFNLYE